jgi:hypothetical protein
MDDLIKASKEREEKLKQEVDNLVQSNLALQTKLEDKDKKIRSLQKRDKLYINLSSNPPQPAPVRPTRKLRGGNSAGVRTKLHKELQSYLLFRFETAKARQQALYEHFKKFPEEYASILNHQTITQAEFDSLCQANPQWVKPIQQDVLNQVQNHWSTARCLSLQINCKVGHGEKYQDLINILAKVFNETSQKWDRVESYHKGSGLLLSILKSKGAVNTFRDEIQQEIPIIQDARQPGLI